MFCAVQSFEQNMADVQKQLTNMQPFLGIAFDVLDYSERKMTTASLPEFKSSLTARYSKMRSGISPSGETQQLLYCQLTHSYLPSNLVIASHLWKREWAR